MKIKRPVASFWAATAMLVSAATIASSANAQHFVAVGGFQEWSPSTAPELTPIGDGIYQVTLKGLTPGEFHEFKILETDELPADWGNNEWTATNNWFKVCNDGSVTIKLNTNLGGAWQDAANVGTSSTNWTPQLVGSFQVAAGGASDWNNADPLFDMAYVSGTTWSKTINVSTPGTYYLKIVTGGVWTYQFNGHGYANLPGEDFSFTTTVENQDVAFTFDTFAPSLTIEPIGGTTGPIVVGTSVYHGGFSGPGAPPWNAVDTRAQLVARGAAPVAMSLDNLINSIRGLNGVVVDIDGLSGLEDVAFECRVSPTGEFDEGKNPVAQWETAPTPTSIVLHAGQGAGGSDRVLIRWADNAIKDRYLSIKIVVGKNLAGEYYVGHLLGETSGNEGNIFTVSFSDIPPIRSAIGTSASSSSLFDIDKNGGVSFADISAMRSNVGQQLRQITIPAQE